MSVRLYLKSIDTRGESIGLRYAKFNGRKEELTTYKENVKQLEEVLKDAEADATFKIFESGSLTTRTPIDRKEAIDFFTQTSEPLIKSPSSKTEKLELQKDVNKVAELGGSKPIEAVVLPIQEMKEEAERAQMEREELAQRTAEGVEAETIPEMSRQEEELEKMRMKSKEKIREQRERMAMEGEEATQRFGEMIEPEGMTETERRRQLKEALAQRGGAEETKEGEGKGIEDIPTPAEGGPAVAPAEVGGAGMMEGAGASAPAVAGAPAPAPAPGAPSGEDLSEDQAKKALKQNPEADVNPALIGPDSAEEMKGLIYKDAFSLIFSDRSGIRELEQFKKSDENKEGERKAPDILYHEAEEIREGYKDQLKVVKLVFSVADEKKYLLQQWQEMHTLKKGAVQNITSGKSANPLNNYDSIGLVVDISSLGISLDDFLNFAERAGLSASGADGPSGGTTKLSGFRKPVDLSDVAPKKDDEEQDVKPMSEEQAEKDKKEKSEVVGAPEYITNRPVRGVMVKDGMRVKKHKEKRIKLYL